MSDVNAPLIALYFQIELMNATVAVVIVDDETNISLSWTTGFPKVLLTDELTQTHDKCNHFGRVAIPGICDILSSSPGFH